MSDRLIQLALAQAYARGKKRHELRKRISDAQKRRSQHRKLVLVHSAQKES